ncbi:MAG: aerobic-type carbon monoxide dehydrogenase, large subunit CoxL/CutL-like protein [Deltaproteobacteria bacterium]|nr:aerobic-type carbon monoxide dehydrogenase, large subunit CoxL/CutL-like protein [Deltaproteobacteria bacterium]
MEKHAIIGERIRNVDSPDKATGRAVYGTDFRLPGMLHGKILRSPFAHARILRVDTSRAEKVRGVKAVITAEDTPKIKYGAQIHDEYPLAVEKVRYEGDEIAAVAAVDEEAAQEALERIKIDYEPLPAVFSPQEAMAPGAPAIHESPQNIVTHIDFERGCVEEGFRSADVVLEDVFKSANVHQAYLEPHVCVAQADTLGNVTLWGSLQAPARNREILSRILKIPQSRIRIVQTTVGGGFGGKATQLISLYPICVFLAIKAGQPVRILNTWEEEFAASRSRMPAEIRMKLGIRKDGTFTAKEIEILANCGAYAGTGPAVVGTTATRATSLYRFPHVKCKADLVYTNLTPIGSYRGYGNPQLHFVMESMIDMASEAIDWDPLEVRVKNAIRKGETSVHGFAMNSCRLSECLEEAAVKSGWREKRGRRRKEGRGIGMASMIHVSGNRAVYPFFDGSTAYVRIQPHGGVEVVTGEAEIGQGSNTVFAQITAETLGVPLQEVRVLPVDTDHSPFALGTFASRVTTLGGKAVLLAAEDARQKLLSFAAAKMEVSPEKLELKEGRIRIKNSADPGMEYQEAAKLASHASGGAPILGVGAFSVPSTVQIPDASRYGNISMAYSFGVQVAEVQVDRKTGKVTIQKFFSVHDSGTVINPLLGEGQVEGGVVQGIGFALMEEILRKEGRVLNGNFTDYRIPTIRDVPPIETVFVEEPDPFGPFGAKGLGEITQVPTAAAIANAIYDAVGVRLKELPMTPERILASIRKRNR